MHAHPRALRLEILSAYDAGESATSLRTRYGVSVTTLRRWQELRDTTGDVVPRPHGGGRARRLDDEGMAALLALRTSLPDASVGVLVAHLAAQGIHVPPSTAAHYLHEAGFVRHAVKRSAKAELAARSPERARRYRRAPAPPDRAHRRAYPSDLTDPEWALLVPLLPAPKPGGRRAWVDRREVVNAIFYVLRAGCPWRMLPHDFPAWETVYDLYARWRDTGVWERVNATLRTRVRVKAGRQATPSAVIVDSQSVKTTEKGGLAAMTGPSGSTGVSATS